MTQPDPAQGANLLGTTNWDSWTYTTAIEALTGDKPSLEFGGSDPVLKWNAEVGDVSNHAGIKSSDFYYFAFGKQYFGVDIEQKQLTEWDEKVRHVVDIAEDVGTDGKRGTFDRDSMWKLEWELQVFNATLTRLATNIGGWVTLTSGKDGPIAGKAVDIIRARLDQYSRTLDTWSDQVVDTYGGSLLKASYDARQSAWRLLNTLVVPLFQPTTYDGVAYNSYAEFLRALPGRLIAGFHKQYLDHLIAGGLIHGTKEYDLDNVYRGRPTIQVEPNQGPYGPQHVPTFEGGKGMAGVEARIRAVLGSTPIGNVLSPDTWANLSNQIVEQVDKAVEPLSEEARRTARLTNDAYLVLSRSFPSLQDPPPLNVNTSTWNGGPNLGNGSPNLNLNLDSLVNGLGGNGGPNLNLGGSGRPNIGGNGGPNLNLGGGAGGAGGGPSLAPNGLGDSFFGPNGLATPPGTPPPTPDLPPFIGGSAGLPPGGGGSGGPGAGPNGRAPLGSRGEVLGPDGRPVLGPDGEIRGPDGRPILGPNGELLGPDGNPILGPDGKPIPGTLPTTGGGGNPNLPGLPQLPDGPGLPENPNVPGLPHTPGLPHGPGAPGSPHLPGLPDLPDASDGVGVPGAGPGGGSSGPPASGSGVATLPALPQLSSDGTLSQDLGGGSPHVTPETLAPLIASENQTGGGPAGGGYPMYPPPMGGMGAPGSHRDERERQTWLTEDEAVWGTKAVVVGSVIGRPGDEAEPEEDMVLLGPVRASRPGPRPGTRPPVTPVSGESAVAGRRETPPDVESTTGQV
ncbi:hypothetical protein [Micromonospora craniellae]|uniref:Uncharacterized protein n=1 Tax=Micromonospora craniellae TaxID=2294034 RepID=A0A372FYJ1_9ACTN|nr:hypothetical protein [Micromonospora craniellae]RFS45560.1 hypothetical protein D0Q02_15770 [Micromonospora craniellae]